MKSLLKLLMVVCLLGTAYGQRDGVPSFGEADTHDVDTVNLYTLVPTINIPILSKQEAVPFSETLTASQTCVVQGTGQQSKLTCAASNAFNLYSLGFMDSTVYYTSSGGGAHCPNGVQATTYWGWYIVSSDGLDAHPLPPSDSVIVGGSGGNCPASSFTAATIDNSGYTVKVSTPGNTSTFNFTVTSASGVTATNVPGFGYPSTETDPFGNTSSVTQTPNGNYLDFSAVDSLNSNPVVYYAAAVDAQVNPYATYTDTTGTTQSITLTQSSTPYTVNPADSGCAYQGYGNPIYPVTSISFPDSTSMSFTMEPGTKGSGSTSGRIASFTTREGALISYSYPPPCGMYGGLTSLTLTRTTPDGTTTYTLNNSSGLYSTTVLDPGKNKTVYYWSNTGTNQNIVYAPQAITEVDTYQNTGTVTTPSYTLTSSTVYCYNGNQSNCRNAINNYPITQRDVYSYTGSGSKAMSHNTEVYDSYGNVTSSTSYDYITGQTLTTNITYGSWAATSCTAIGNGIYDHPCAITTVNGSNTISSTHFTYDSNTGARRSKSSWTGSEWLTTGYVPNANGTVASVTDINGQLTTLGYAATNAGGCNSLLPTSSSTTVNSIVISSSQTWDCNGAVILTATDANGHTPSPTQYDPMFRPILVYDNLGNSVQTSYTSNSITSVPSFGTTSVIYLDTLGRRSIIQHLSSGTSYDTQSFLYGWNGTNFQTQESSPCTEPADTPCTVYGSFLTNPARGAISSTDAIGGTIAYAYNANDSSLTSGPAPTGEHVKTSQSEIDGFGRPKSICGLETSGGAACGQVMGNSGILTSYAYSFGSGSATTTATRGVQTHTSIDDAIGRTVSGSTPERGTITDTYDSLAANYCNGQGTQTSFGDLMATGDAAGNHVCFFRDKLHRVTDIGNNSQSSANPCKRFRYDDLSLRYHTAPSDYPSTSAAANIVGRLMEETTDDCNNNELTDEWVAYNANGWPTDFWESTPHSGGFYHVTIGYNPNGTVASVSGIPGYTAYTFGTDTEGRPFNASQGSTWIIGSSSTTGVSYDPGGNPVTVPIGTNSADKDTFTYNDLGQMTNYTFSVGGKTMSGTNTWNSIGSLDELNITDTFNSGGAQDCSFVYDDVARLSSDNCGSIWTQTFTYDQYDNLSKNGVPTYNLSNNQASGSSYDAAGNLLYDGTNTYAPDVYGKFQGVRAGNNAVSCGSAGSYCVTRDASGRIVETSNGTTYRELLWSPIGRLAQMNGQTTQNAYITLPGGLALNASATGGATKYIQHPDWLGTKRLSTSLGSRSQIFDTAYAPYGESYDTFGTLKPDYTGDLQDVFSGLFDTPNRELNLGRWLSCDPAMSTWNCYSYATDPNSMTDPSGLWSVAQGDISGCGMMSAGCIAINGGGLEPFDSDPDGLSAKLDNFQLDQLKAQNQAWMAAENSQATQEGPPPIPMSDGCDSYGLGCNAPARQSFSTNALTWKSADPAWVLIDLAIQDSMTMCRAPFTCAGVSSEDGPGFISGNDFLTFRGKLRPPEQLNLFNWKTGGIGTESQGAFPKVIGPDWPEPLESHTVSMGRNIYPAKPSPFPAGAQGQYQYYGKWLVLTNPSQELLIDPVTDEPLITQMKLNYTGRGSQVIPFPLFRF